MLEHPVEMAAFIPMKALLMTEPLGLGPAIRVDHKAQSVQTASITRYVF